MAFRDGPNGPRSSAESSLRTLLLGPGAGAAGLGPTRLVRGRAVSKVVCGNRHPLRMSASASHATWRCGERLGRTWPQPGRVPDLSSKPAVRRPRRRRRTTHPCAGSLSGPKPSADGEHLVGSRGEAGGRGESHVPPLRRGRSPRWPARSGGSGQSKAYAGHHGRIPCYPRRTFTSRPGHAVTWCSSGPARRSLMARPRTETPASWTVAGSPETRGCHQARPRPSATRR